jgi:hypothetical protein
MAAAVCTLGYVRGSEGAEYVPSWSKLNECLYAPVTYRFLSGAEVADCILKRVGSESLEAHRGRHENVVREIIWDQNRGAPIVLEYVWPETGRGVLTISDPTVRSYAFAVPFQRSLWDDIRANLLRLKASGAVLHGAPAGPETNTPESLSKANVICLDPRTSHAETTFDGSPSVSVDMDECYSDDFPFADFLLKAAIQLAPDCKRLRLSAFGISTELLVVCARLSGDKLAAADAWNGSDNLRNEDFSGHPQTSHDFERLMFREAAIRFDGAPVVRGSVAVAATFAKAIAGLPYFSNQLSTASAKDDVVVIRGILIGGIVKSSTRLDYEAPYTQIWKRARSGKMLLVDWGIGKFEPGED